jgi:hypothetical protein
MGCRVAVAVIDEECVVVDAVLRQTHPRVRQFEVATGQRGGARLTKRSIISCTVSEPLPSSSSREYRASSCTQSTSTASASWRVLGPETAAAHLLEVQLLEMADNDLVHGHRNALLWSRASGRTEQGQRRRHQRGGHHAVGCCTLSTVCVFVERRSSWPILAWSLRSKIDSPCT